MWGGLAGVASMGDPVGVDPRSASAALGNRPHHDHLRTLQVACGRPSGLEGQGDETVCSALRAWPHCALIVARCNQRNSADRATIVIRKDVRWDSEQVEDSLEISLSSVDAFLRLKQVELQRSPRASTGPRRPMTTRAPQRLRMV